MIKNYSFFAKWRKKDVEFLNGLKLNRTIEEGYDGFLIEEGNDYKKIIDYYSKKDSLFWKTKPPEFSVKFTGVTFSKKELEGAKYYTLTPIGNPKGYPQPKEKYEGRTFSFECDDYRVSRKQIAPFRIKKPKWSKNQVIFHLNWEWDFVFVKKDFFLEVLAPLGLKFKEVLLHGREGLLKDTVQLDIPVSKSKILIENSAYDIFEPRCGKKQYSRQNLDFFPPLEKEFDFHICYTQEEFDGGFKRIIISKSFCELLIRHKVINYNSQQLIPLKV